MTNSYLLTPEKFNILYNMLAKHNIKEESIIRSIRSIFTQYQLSTEGENLIFSYNHEHLTHNFRNYIVGGIETKFIHFPTIDLANLQLFYKEYTIVPNIASSLEKKERNIIIQFLIENFSGFINLLQKSVLDNYDSSTAYPYKNKSYRCLIESFTFLESLEYGNEITSPDAFSNFTRTMNVIFETEHDEKVQLIALNSLKHAYLANIDRHQLLTWFAQFSQINGSIFIKNLPVYDELKNNFTEDEFRQYLKKDELVRVLSSQNNPFITRKVAALSFIVSMNKYKIQNNILMPILINNFKLFGYIIDDLCQDFDGFLSSSFSVNKQELVFNVIHENGSDVQLTPFLENIIDACASLNDKILSHDSLLVILEKHKEVFLLSKKLEEEVSHKEIVTVKKNKI